MEGYYEFSKYASKIGFVRFEDFTKSPEIQLEILCQKPAINYDPEFTKNWWKYFKITCDTDGKRYQSKRIETIRTRKIDVELIKRLEKNSDYLKSIDILGYDHPIP